MPADPMHVTRHWVAGMARTNRGGWHSVIVDSAEDAADYRAQGWTVTGPFVPEPVGTVDPDDPKTLETLARVIENRHGTLHGIGDTLREALAEIKRGEFVVTPREVTARADVARVEHLQQQMGDES